MPVGVRQLSVLGEFKPFGLVAETLDGKPADTNFPEEEYHYFLFDPDVSKQRDEVDHIDSAPPSTDRSDYELFIRGNRITWSIGSRVYKRFTLPSPVIKTCWCRMGDMKEAILSVLRSDSLTMYNTSGEIASVPLPRSVVSIWPLPFGLLLQQVSEGNLLVHSSSPSSTSFSNSRDANRSKRDVGYSPQNNYSPMHGCDYTNKRNGASPSSHLILKDPLEEPEPIFIEERGRLNIMKEFDEKTIWTSEHVPWMVSFNKVKRQHSVWIAEVVSSSHEIFNGKLDDVVPAGVLEKQYLFRRIFQGISSQTASSKVFLATGDDSAPVISFLLQDQRKLLCMRLSIQINYEITHDTKLDMNWSLPAIAAAPVSVTRPRVKMGALPLLDIIVLTPEYDLVLYSGKQCLCRYILPPFLSDQPLKHNRSTKSTSNINDLKIVGLADAVEGRINVTVNNATIYRCTLQCSPSSSLVSDCLSVMVDGLSSNFYTHFLVTFWGAGNLASPHTSVDSEWQSFCNTVLQGCRKSNLVSPKLSNKDIQPSWEFLINSKYHKNYQKHNCIFGPSPGTLFAPEEPESFEPLRGAEKLFYTDFLRETLDCLHAVYESMKLDILRKRDLGLLVVLLCKISNYLVEGSYLDHYIRDFPYLLQDFGMLERSKSAKVPPSLLRWLESCLRGGCSSANVHDLSPLICKGGTSVVNWARKVVAFYSLLCGAEQLERRLSSGVFCNITSGSSSNEEELTILAMVGEGFGLQQLDLLPAGASLPLRHALDKCRESPPLDWPAAAYVLLGREDLALSCFAHLGKSMAVEAHASMKLISMSAPYMLHLHPTTIHSSISDSIDSENIKTEDVDSAEGSAVDGMEHIFNYSTQLRFGRDLRLNEVRRLLCSAKPVVVQTSVNPIASDQDVQQAQLWQLAQRTTALPFGRGAFTLATTCTLLTEALSVPKLVLAGKLPAQQNAMVNLDPNVRNVEELKCWPEFHNAVAAGLRLAPVQGKASRTWILYNRPGEPDAIHAGLLLALGLHGHLKVLSITDIYQYYSLEHESTTVGLMLGLAASYRGTMQPAISKSLYVHIPTRHPLSFPELEVPTLLQFAAVMSVGLLYEGAAHPQTMQILLGEIGRRSAGDNVLEREGYAVSAGYALGLVALGRGNDALGFKDTLVDRLFQYIGGREFQNDRLNLSTSQVDEHNRNTGQIMDGSSINIDVTASGSIIALGLMYLKTESQLIFSRLSIPQTCFDLHYVRPDLIMLRVIARSLIMWSSVHPSEDWIQSQLPEVVKNGMKGLGDDIEEDTEAFVRAYINIITGSCISLGLRFAGTRDGNSQDLLHRYAIYFLNEIKPVSVTSGQAFPKGLAKHVDRGTLETCLHFIVISLCVVMAGSGNIKTFKLLKFLRTRNTVDSHANYGTQMAVSLGIGFLFLGGGMRSFSTDNSSIAALFIALYPRLPSGPNDNRCHLQAFRHLYVLATEGRWIQTIDVDTGLPVYAPLEVTVNETVNYSETSFCEVTPSILPERAILKSVRVCGPRYWPQVIGLIPEDKHWWTPGDKKDPFNSGVLYVKRKVGVCPYVDDPVGCRSLLSRAIHKVFGLKQSKGTNPGIKSISEVTMDQLVSTFSSDPSLIAFAQLCCDPSWCGSQTLVDSEDLADLCKWSWLSIVMCESIICRSENDFEEFCFQILFECVSKDRPGLLQVYLSLYTMVASMIHQVNSSTCAFSDCVFLSSLKLALAYNDALLSGRLKTSGGGIVQSTFLGSLRKRIEEILSLPSTFREDLSNYLRYEKWPAEDPQRRVRSINMSLYLCWYCLPPPAVVKRVVDRMKHANPSSSYVPFLRLLLPGTHISAIRDLDQIFK